MQIILLTFWASSGPSGPFFFLPGVVAAFAIKHPGLINDAIIAAFDINAEWPHARQRSNAPLRVASWEYRGV
jgi:hypothetical protein